MLSTSATMTSYHVVPQEYRPELLDEDLEDDGRSLTAYDQYRVEVLNIARLTPYKERQLADRARAGDVEAKQQLVHGCLPAIWRLAPKYVRLPDDVKRFDAEQFMDIVQAGNEAMIEHLDYALAAYNTCGTLIVIARHAMMDFAIKNTLMPVPEKSYREGRRAPLTVRIINQSDVEAHRQGILDEMLAGPPVVLPHQVNERNPKRTYVLNALKRLSKYQRLAIMVSFQIDSKNTGYALSRDAKCCKAHFSDSERYNSYKSSAMRRLRQILTLD